MQCKQLIMFQNKKVSLHAALMCIINNIIRVSTPLLLLQNTQNTLTKKNIYKNLQSDWLMMESLQGKNKCNKKKFCKQDKTDTKNKYYK